MSEAKKEKVQMDPKYILKLAGVLMLISAIVAGLLGLVNGVTWEKIAEIQAQKLQASLRNSEVLPGKRNAILYTADLRQKLCCKSG